MRDFIKEFKDFIASGNLLEVAVAFILGLAIKAVIDAFIANIVNPIIGAIVGKPNLDTVLRFTLRKGKADDPTDDSILAIGPVLTQILSLVLVGLVLFMMLKAYNKMRKPAEAAPAGPTEVELLTEIRDQLRARS